MPATPTLPAAPPSSGALRIVLFGMPDAGKSSLLGALAQAAQTQEHLLNGTLTDRSQGLIELQRRLYEDRPRETLEEVTPYPIALVPRQAASAAREAVLVDCDGRVANELLSRRRTLGTSQADGVLARAILEADTLVLVVDASASAEAIERDFGQFGRFLRLLEQNRGQRSEVGGLPVYLVLTKCDLLARASDTNIAWMERIEERKREVDRRFKEFLAGQADQGPLPFGKIELHLWATAVKRPALKDAPAKPREPYGVAELFRQCLDSAVVFRQRQARATRRLSGILTAVFALAGGMLLLILYFLLSRPGSETTALENEIRTFRSGHDRSAELLKEPVDDRLKQLQRFKNDADFKKLPTELQAYVVHKVNELEAYQRYNREFLEKVRDPKFAKSLEELNQIEDSLKQTPLPPPYEAEWAQTRAAQRRRQWEQDVEIMHREIKAAMANLKSWLDRREQLRTEPLTEEQRLKKLQDLLVDADRLPYQPEDRNKYLPGSNRLTYENVIRFNSVDDLWHKWQKARQQIKAVPP